MRGYAKCGKEWIQKAQDKESHVEGHKGTKTALLQKLQSLPENFFPISDYSVVDTIKQSICHGISCLVDISGIPSEDQKRLVILIASAVARHYKETWEKQYDEWEKLPTLLITLEEAHEFLANEPKVPKTIFSRIALTYRKYRVGLNAVTPRPARIDTDVFAELWTKVSARATDSSTFIIAPSIIQDGA